MYEIFTANSKTEKRLNEYLFLRRLSGKWACWFGSNIRCIYIINEEKKQVIIEAAGTRKIY